MYAWIQQLIMITTICKGEMMNALLLIVIICVTTALVDTFVFNGKYEPFLPLLGFMVGTVIAKLF